MSLLNVLYDDRKFENDARRNGPGNLKRRAVILPTGTVNMAMRIDLQCLSMAYNELLRRKTEDVSERVPTVSCRK